MVTLALFGPLNGVEFFVLNPEGSDEGISGQAQGQDSGNDDSIVLKLVYKDFSALFCGDVTDTPAARMIEAYGGFLRSDVMKVPHHGGSFKKEEIADKFFQYIHPEISIISVARMNRYNMPSKKTLGIINNLKLISYTTKDCGAIVVSSEGHGLKAEVFNK